jgi:hypothetical protein
MIDLLNPALNSNLPIWNERDSRRNIVRQATFNVTTAVRHIGLFLDLKISVEHLIALFKNLNLNYPCTSIFDGAHTLSPLAGALSARTFNLQIYVLDKLIADAIDHGKFGKRRRIRETGLYMVTFSCACIEKTTG